MRLQVFILLGLSAICIDGTCHQGSADLKELLLRHEEWYTFNVVSDVGFDFVFEGFYGDTIENFPDDSLCVYQGVVDRPELIYRFHEDGFLYRVYKMVYDAIEVNLAKYNWDKEHHEWDDPITDIMDSDIRSTGLFTFDQDGVEWLLRVIGLYHTLYPEYIRPQLTQEQIQNLDSVENVKTVTNGMRKIWNHVHTELSNNMNNASASVYMREVFTNWTGIPLKGPHIESMGGTHNFIKMIVTDILYQAKNRGVPGMYELFYNQQVLYNIVSHGYPPVAAFLKDAPEEVQHWLPLPPEILELLISVLRTLDDMGLLDLP